MTLYDIMGKTFPSSPRSLRAFYELSEDFLGSHVEDLSQLAPFAMSILGAFSEDLLGSHEEDISQPAPLARSILG